MKTACSKRKAEKGSDGPAKKVQNQENVAAGREEKPDYRDKP